LEDACAAFDQKVHAVAVEALRPVARVGRVGEMVSGIL